MPSTERDIFSPVDGCFNQIDVKPCFRCVPHKTQKIVVRIEMNDKNRSIAVNEMHSILLIENYVF